MHMPPNLTKLLYQWGLGNEVNKLAQFAEGLEFVHCKLYDRRSVMKPDTQRKKILPDRK